VQAAPEPGHALFREVNQRILAVTERLGSHPADDGLSLAIVCECANGGCMSQLLLDVDDYARIRAHPLHFVVLAGHEQRSEHVVEEGAGYVVVELATAAVGA
jgi:hypothetical protein